MGDIWKSWGELRHLARGKTVVCYGRSEYWIPKTVAQLPAPPAYVVDSAAAYEGTEFEGLRVSRPERLLEEPRDDLYVVITSSAHEEIAGSLAAMGFEAGRHFCCCPEYRDYAQLEAMRNYERDVIVASPDYGAGKGVRASRAGGGIFRYRIGPGRNAAELLVPGQFRQLVPVGDHIFAVEFNESRVYVFDRAFKPLEKFPLDRPHYCGIDYDPVRNLVILVNSATDAISFHEPNGFRRVERMRFSAQSDDEGASRHHLNDACVVGDQMFVSYFSRSGNWKRNVYDGGIGVYDLARPGTPPLEVVRDLWMPHSPKIINGQLCYLESAPGRLYLSSAAPAARFPGFARGLAHDGRYYYVGQSESMYLGRLPPDLGLSTVNAGFYLFDAETRAARFYPMLDTMNVHDLLILD